LLVLDAIFGQQSISELNLRKHLQNSKPKPKHMGTLNSNIFKGICAMLMLCSLTSKAQTTVFQDDFNSINTANWTFETGGGGWGNNEKQYYQSNNATIVNGQLVITAKKESVGGMPYTSSRMKTQGKKFWTYGHMEASIKFPVGQGLWPAFWMLGENIGSVGWPACGEIDILEHVNTDNIVYGTIHWDFNGHASYSGNTTVNTGAFNTYSIDWDASAIKWYVNGAKYHEANIAGGVNGTEEFSRNFFFLINLAVAGDWPGQTVDESRLPAQLIVDYVKVTQGGTPPPTGVATFYKDCNYGGTAVGLATGTYTMSQLNAKGILNDDISSVKVNAGYKVTLYWDDNFTGTTKVLTSDMACDGTWNDKTTSLKVETNTTAFSTVVQAESYISMAGVQLENTTDAGGGQNVGWIDAGDWMAYNVNIPSAGTYRVIYRVASPNAGKTLRLEKDAGATQLGTVTVPNSGGWQNWTTVAHNVTLPAGAYTIGLATATGGFNINYFTITSNLSARSVEEAIETSNEEIRILPSPNPFVNNTTISVNMPQAGYAELSVMSSVGTKVADLHKGNLAAGNHEFDFNAENLPSGLYIYTFNHKGKRVTGKLLKSSK
jgi:beta-glucanase (GH16 family)